MASSVRCRGVTWRVRAIVGVASMAAAISAADRSLNVVISLSRWRTPLLGLSDSQTCIRAPVFRNASAYFRIRNHGYASTQLPVDSFRRADDSTFSFRAPSLGMRLAHLKGATNFRRQTNIKSSDETKNPYAPLEYSTYAVGTFSISRHETKVRSGCAERFSPDRKSLFGAIVLLPAQQVGLKPPDHR